MQYVEHRQLPVSSSMFKAAARSPAVGGILRLRFQKCLHGSAPLSEPKLNSVPIDKTRNIGIIAHIDAGKTTTTERMLFYSGKTLRIGNVDEGDTVTDYLPSERERGITIQLAAISIPWNNHKINIIDTPGHADFTFEVTRSLRVLDGAVTILDAVAGVEAQTEKVWKQAAGLGIPRIAYVNKMDRPGAGFSRTVKEIVAKLHTRAVCINLPYFKQNGSSNPEFSGVLDVIYGKLLVWDPMSDSSGKSVRAIDLDPENPELAPLYEVVAKSRESMVETLGEFDEKVIESFFEHEDYMKVPPLDLQEAIKHATLSNQITPVLCGSSFKNMGVQPLMDAVVSYLPSPLQTALPEITSSSSKRVGKKKKKSTVSQAVGVPVEMDKTKGLVINKNQNLTVALAFKVTTHPVRGVMAFFRVYSGKLASNSTVINTRTGQKIHLRKLMLMHGDVPEEVQTISAGNIGVVAGTDDDIVTGDTFVSQGVTHSKSFNETEKNLMLLPIAIPPPLFNSSIEPATAGDERYMNECIKTLLREDPSFQVHLDEDLGQTVLSGMGELHLEIIKDRLVNDMKAKVRLRNVAVSYKETIAKPDGSTVTVISPENPDVFATVTLESFEGGAAESSYAEEDGAVILDVDNNVIILEPGATPQHMTQAVEERRWKAEQPLEELQDTLIQGCATGLHIGGPMFGLPLHSCVIRITLWNFPVEEKAVAPAMLLDVGRKVINKAVSALDEKPGDNFCVLEPIMKTNVHVDSDTLGEVVHDLNNRCLATILSIDDEASDSLDTQNWAHDEAEKIFLPEDYTMKNMDREIKNKKTIVAETPLKEMIGYLSRLRSITQGRGMFDMQYQGMRRAVKARLSSIKSEFTFF